MNTKILLIVLFFIEIMKVYVGYQICFGEKIRRWWIITGTGLFYSVLVFGMKYEYAHIHIIMYIIVFIIFIFMQSGKIEARVLRISILLLINSCFDAIFGVLGNYLYKMGTISYNFSRMLESVLVLCLLWILILLKHKVQIDRKSILLFARKKIIFVVILMIPCILLNITGLLYLQPYVTNKRFEAFTDILSVAALGSMVGLVAFIIYIRNANEKMESLVEAERNLKKMQENYYLALLEREESTRKYRHDMIGHLLCLNELSKEEGAIQTEQYIANLKEKIMTIQKKCYVTENKILDILLNYYLSQIDSADILVMGICNCKLAITDVEFCVIFSNIIQNAVEELKKQDVEKRYFRMKIVQGLSYLKIEVRNSLRELNKKKSWFKSEKKDERNHGFGLKNIKETLKKIDGSIEIQQGDKEFLILIMLKCIKK